MTSARLTATGPTSRYLVITAYHKENRHIIERCIQSIKSQIIPTDHILIADGFPQAWVDDFDVRHIKLDRSHNDYGDTPRGVGALLAIAEAYDGFCFCDADNYLEATHVQACLASAACVGEQCDYVIARRFLRRPDETILPVADEPVDQHVDTNCFFFLPGSYHLLHLFSNIPKEMAAIGDRLFYARLRQRELVSATVSEPTVNYQCLWLPYYEALGEAPPPGAKPAIDSTAIKRWMSELSTRQKEIVRRRSGIAIK